jgi:hypothetical protein
MKTMKKGFLAISVAAVTLLVVVAAMYIGKLVAAEAITGYASPTSLTLTVYNAVLYTNKSDSTGVHVFGNSTTGETIDVITDAGTLFGQAASVPAGEYHRMKLTVRDAISVDSPDPCGGAALTGFSNGISALAPNPAGTVDLYFATDLDGGGEHTTFSRPDGSAARPFGLGAFPIEARDGATTNIDFIWDVVNLMQCSDNNTAANTADDYPRYGVITAEIKEYVEEPAACALKDKSYYLIRSTLRSYYDGPDPTVERYTNDASIVTAWGMFYFGETSTPSGPIPTATVMPGPGLPASAWGTPGMSEHRHMLLKLQYPNTGDDGIVDNGTLEVIPYEMYGNEIFLNFGEHTIEGAISSDCSTILLTDFGHDAEFIIAVEKPDATDLSTLLTPGAGPLYSFNSDKVMVNINPTYELGYSNSTTGTSIYNSTYIHMQPNLNILNYSNDSFFEWRGMAQFMPVYNSGAGGGNTPFFDHWLSAGPKEYAHMDTGLSSFLQFRADGIANAGTGAGSMDEFLAITKNGSLVHAGTVNDHDPCEAGSGHPCELDPLGFDELNHRLGAGLAVPVAANPSVNDMVGTWLIAGLSMEFGDGGNGWADDYSLPAIFPAGDEQAYFKLSRGVFNVDSTGVINGSMTNKNLMTDELRTDHTNAKIQTPHQECYYIDPNGQNGSNIIADAASCPAGGTVLDVFGLKDYNPASGQYDVPMGGGRLLLDENKKVMLIWEQIDEGGHIYNTPGEIPAPCDRVNTEQPWDFNDYGCGDSSTYGMFYIGVKIK